jgi:hypothetical protein
VAGRRDQTLSSAENNGAVVVPDGVRDDFAIGRRRRWGIPGQAGKGHSCMSSCDRGAGLERLRFVCMWMGSGTAIRRRNSPSGPMAEVESSFVEAWHAFFA